MKKLISIAAAMLLFAIGASAQIYVNAGTGISTKQIDIDDDGYSNFNSTAVYAGLSYNIALAGNLGIEPGIYYLDSFKTNDMESLADSSVKYRYNALVVPVELTYKLGLGNAGIRFFAGPSFNYGFTSSTTNILLGKVSTKVDSYEKETEGRFNVSASVGAAFEYASFRLKVGYKYGLSNLDLTDLAPTRRNLFSVGLGYAF